MKDWKFEETGNELIIKMPKDKNYTIEELKQKLINYLCDGNKKYDNVDVEIMKLLLS